MLTYPFFTQKRGQVILQTKHSIGHFNKHYMGMEDFSNFSLKGWKSEPKNYQQHKRTQTNQYTERARSNIYEQSPKNCKKQIHQRRILGLGFPAFILEWKLKFKVKWLLTVLLLGECSSVMAGISGANSKLQLLHSVFLLARNSFSSCSVFATPFSCSVFLFCRSSLVLFHLLCFFHSTAEGFWLQSKFPAPLFLSAVPCFPFASLPVTFLLQIPDFSLSSALSNLHPPPLFFLSVLLPPMCSRLPFLSLFFSLFPSPSPLLIFSFAVFSPSLAAALFLSSSPSHGASIPSSIIIIIPNLCHTQIQTPNSLPFPPFSPLQFTSPQWLNTFAFLPCFHLGPPSSEPNIFCLSTSQDSSAKAT